MVTSKNKANHNDCKTLKNKLLSFRIHATVPTMAIKELYVKS